MLSQAQHISLPAIAVCLLFTYATMVPVMHSARMEPFGFFTPRCVIELADFSYYRVCCKRYIHMHGPCLVNVSVSVHMQ